MQTRIIAFAALFAGLSGLQPAHAGDDLGDGILARSSPCFASPLSLRGVNFTAALDLDMGDDGQVAAVRVAAVSPRTETHAALAADFGEAIRRCGPHQNEGMKTVRVELAWPR